MANTKGRYGGQWKHFAVNVISFDTEKGEGRHEGGGEEVLIFKTNPVCSLFYLILLS